MTCIIWKDAEIAIRVMTIKAWIVRGQAARRLKHIVACHSHEIFSLLFNATSGHIINRQNRRFYPQYIFNLIFLDPRRYPFYTGNQRLLRCQKAPAIDEGDEEKPLVIEFENLRIWIFENGYVCLLISILINLSYNLRLKVINGISVIKHINGAKR